MSRVFQTFIVSNEMSKFANHACSHDIYFIGTYNFLKLSVLFVHLISFFFRFELAIIRV